MRRIERSNAVQSFERKEKEKKEKEEEEEGRDAAVAFSVVFFPTTRDERRYQEQVQRKSEGPETQGVLPRAHKNRHD